MKATVQVSISVWFTPPGAMHEERVVNECWSMDSDPVDAFGAAMDALATAARTCEQRAEKASDEEFEAMRAAAS